MFDNLRAALLVPDVRKRLGFVLFAFAWFIFMIHVQLPNVNETAWQHVLSQGAFYNLLGFLSGGALQHLSIIAMGITPYINASIIMQLMTVVLPQLEELAKKGGEEGRKKIGQYTRWLTIALAVLQATFMTNAMKGAGVFYDTSIFFQLYAIIAMVAGTLFLMWLGEQISDRGIGNGVSLIIFIGIVLRYPSLIAQTASTASSGGISLLNLAIFTVVTLGIIIGIIFMYQGQRRVPVQQARRVVGRKMFAGRSTYIPLRLNNAGVISIIFAISILLLPQQALTWFSGRQTGTALYQTLFTIPGVNWAVAFPKNLAAVSETLSVHFSPSSLLYSLVYFLLVVIFTFFYSSIVLNTRDVADNLKKTGAFIPGIRPGQPTVDYLNKILLRLTTASAIFLGVLAVAPNVLERGLNIQTIYLGATSLLIIVGVVLDTIAQIEARLAMRDYRGFIKR